MQSVQIPYRSSTNPKVMLTIVSMVISYFGYGFMTFPILIMFGVLIFDYTVIFGPTIPFAGYLASLPGLSSGEDIHIDANIILLGYSIVTAVFWILSKLAQGALSAVRRMVRRTHPANPDPSVQPMEHRTLASIVGLFSRKLLMVSLPITVVFLTAFAAMPFSRLVSRENLPGLSFVIFVFYLITIVSAVVHSGFDTLSQLVLEWGRSIPSK